MLVFVKVVCFVFWPIVAVVGFIVAVADVHDIVRQRNRGVGGEGTEHPTLCISPASMISVGFKLHDAGPSIVSWEGSLNCRKMKEFHVPDDIIL